MSLTHQRQPASLVFVCPPPAVPSEPLSPPRSLIACLLLLAAFPLVAGPPARSTTPPASPPPPRPRYHQHRSTTRATRQTTSPRGQARPKDPSPPSFLPRLIPPVTSTALFLALRCRAYQSPARFRPYPRQGPRSPSPSHHHCQRLCRLHT